MGHSSRIMALLPVLVLVAVVASGCGSQPTPTPVNAFAADDTSGGLATQQAKVEAIEINITESMPVQVYVLTRGVLPDGCTQLGEVRQRREGQTILVQMDTLRPKMRDCAQALVPFERTIRISDDLLSPGNLTIDVNGVRQLLTLSQSMLGLPEQGAREPRQGGDVLEDALVTDVGVQVSLDTPPSVAALIRGTLEGGCRQINSVDQRWEGDTLYLHVITQRDADADCTGQDGRFDVRAGIDIVDLGPGRYTVDANGVTAIFELTEKMLTGGSAEDVEIVPAPVGSAQVIVTDDKPAKVTLHVRGGLPDSCSELDEVTQERRDNHIIVSLLMRRPRDAFCTQVVVPYQKDIELDVRGLPAGEYTVDVNGFAVPLTISERLAGASVTGPTISEARITDVRLSMTRSIPVQVRLRIRGELPDSCTELRSIDVSLDGAIYVVQVLTERDPAAVCSQVIVSFDESVPLDLSEAMPGEYTVDVNGVRQSFELTETMLSVPGKPGAKPQAESATLTGRAPVESIAINYAADSSAPQSVTVRGHLLDGCTTIASITQMHESLDGNTVYIAITTERPKGAMCTQALVPYEEIVDIDLTDLAVGTYRLNVNGVTASFELTQPMIETGGTVATCPKVKFDTSVYVNTGLGYSLHHPRSCQVESSEDGTLVLTFAPTDVVTDAVAARLTIRSLGPVPGGTAETLAEIAADKGQWGAAITRSTTTIGGVPAVLLDGVPGPTARRSAYVVFNDRGLMFELEPWDPRLPRASQDAACLWQVVQTTFRFALPVATQ